MIEVKDKTSMLQTLRGLKDFPMVVEKDGEAVYQCPFCQQKGWFATGNASIAHTPDCALALAFRLLNTQNWSGFDELALKSIVHQLARLYVFPTMPDPDKSGERVEFCPFCKRLRAVKSILFHAPDCIVLEARRIEQLASLHKERVQYLSSFAWERVSNEFLEKIVQVLNENGFDVIK